MATAVFPFVFLRAGFREYLAFRNAVSEQSGGRRVVQKLHAAAELVVRGKLLFPNKGGSWHDFEDFWAARFGGFSEPRLVWFCFLLSGGCAGLAGLFEAAGPVGQLVPQLPVGYGFTAIVVAFLGRLHPAGIVLAGLLMALTYIGGETAQVAMSLPSAATAVFQGLFLFFLLACDVLVSYRVRWRAQGIERIASSE